MRILASAAFCLSTLALLASTGPVAAKPTDAQLSAIKANCRSDYMSNCWGVPKGAQAFQCLKEHMAKLSAGCQQAVNAATPSPAPAPAAAKPESAPAPEPAAAPPATETPPAADTSEAKATPPSAAPESATAPESPPASPPKAAAAPAPEPPAAAATTSSAAPAAAAKTAAPASPAAAPAEAPPVIGFLPPRKKLMVLRNCHQDLETYCADVPFGEGRNLRCLFSNKAALTADCQGALARLTQ